MICLTPLDLLRQWQWYFCRALALAAVVAVPMTSPGAVSTGIAWYPSSDTNVTGYNIYCGTTSHAYTQVVSVGNATNTIISNLQPDTTYYFSIKSHNAAGDEGVFSGEALFAGYAATPNGTGLRVKTFPAALKQDQLVFSLAAGAPAGARINPTNGAVSWVPGYADANTTQSFNVIITDLTNPSASTQETIVVTVSDFMQLMLASVPVQTGSTAALPLSLTEFQFIKN